MIQNIHECKQKRAIDAINKRKNAWFLAPTQLLIQGQWWSKHITHF